MQIFVVNKDYKISADYLDIKRSNKMLIESAQMLCTAINMNGGYAPYKSTHINHPCNIWTRTTLGNFMWLWNYAKCLADRYYNRTGKVHKTATYLDEILELGKVYIDDGPMTPFVNCTNHHKHVENVHDAYILELDLKWKTDKLTPKFE